MKFFTIKLLEFHANGNFSISFLNPYLAPRLPYYEIASISNDSGNTAVHYSIFFNHSRITEVLLSLHPELIHTPNRKGQSPADFCKYPGQLEFLGMMIINQKKLK